MRIISLRDACAGYLDFRSKLSTMGSKLRLGLFKTVAFINYKLGKQLL